MDAGESVGKVGRGERRKEGFAAGQDGWNKIRLSIRLKKNRAGDRVNTRSWIKL